MNPIRFGIIGGGWRSLFFLRIAQAMPEKFEVTGMFVRNMAKAQQLEATWKIKTYHTLDELLKVKDSRFMVVSVPRTIAPQILHTLADRSIPALTETPPAPDIPGLIALYDLCQHGARIQVAEQYHLQPLHAARIALARSGKLGAVTQAQVSIAHDYHGISLIRRFLDVSYASATITAHRFTSPIMAGPDRYAPPEREQIIRSEQTIAYLDFGDKLGVLDFTGDQYHSWIRSPRLLVRGELGEINNAQVRYLADYLTPITYELVRQDAGIEGNLEGYYHKGILAGSEWIYKNPFIPARLSDDEIAIAGCLVGMDEYIDGGPDMYSLAEAAQDHYLSLVIEQAVASGQEVKTVVQPWAR